MSTAKWRANNREKHNAQRRASYRRHAEETKRKNAQYAKEHPEIYVAASHKYRSSITQAGGYFTLEEWFLLRFAVGFKCLCCGKKKKLEADHVLPVSKGGSSWLYNIQPLCSACNRHKNTKTIDYREEYV